MEDEDFELETQRMLEEALAERNELFGKEEEEEDAGTNDEGNEREDNDSGTEGEKSGEKESEEDDDWSSGNGDESEHQEGNENKSKLDFEPIEVEVAGHKVIINSKEELLAYVKKGADSFGKKEETISEEKIVIEQGKLSADDLKLLVDAKNGSKEAIAKLAKIAKVDILDIENEMADNYTQQTEYYRQSEVDKVADEILRDEAHANDFRNIIKTLPEDFVKEVTSDAKDLKAFSGHIKSGIAQKVIPLAIHSQMINGGTFLENYNKVGFAMSQQTKQQEQKREISEREKELRKRASSGSGHNHSQSKHSSKDIWDMPDEEFEKLDLSTLK